MLDSLEDLEEAQEGTLDATPWEQEQNRRRRRRRRASLEQMEGPPIEAIRVHGGHGTGQPAYKSDSSAVSSVVSGASKSDCPAPPPSLSRASSTGKVPASLENAPSGSSLKSPSIDISTFLNLARAPVAAGGAPLSMNARNKLASVASTLPPPRLAAAPSASPETSAPPTSTEPEWERSGYQAASNATAAAASSRPFASITGSSSDRSSAAAASRAFPHMRLHDRASSPSPIPVQPPAFTPSSSRRGLGLPPLVAEDLDDDFDFDPEQDLLAAFHTFDPTHCGVMSTKNLVAIMTSMGEKWNEEEAIEMAEEVDHRREGRFSYSSLVRKVREATRAHHMHEMRARTWTPMVEECDSHVCPDRSCFPSSSVGLPRVDVAMIAIAHSSLQLGFIPVLSIPMCVQ